jgi:predicted TIM-barrel fold metal-dependent hydrolase
LQHFSLDDPRTANLVREAGALSAPVVIDAFPDGDWLMQGFDPLAFARLCNQCPETRIVVAHFGGHHVIDCMMLAKRISNMYFDLSYSLLYYRGSAVTANMTYAMRSLKHRRVFYGSDYPDRSVRETLSGSIAVLSEAGFGREELDRILYLNAEEFYGWQDS